MKSIILKEVKQGLWEKQDYLLAWLVIEVYEVHFQVNLGFEKLIKRVLPLKQELVKLMSNELFLSTFLLKKSMEEKVTLLLEFEEKAKRNIYNQIRLKRNSCENRDQYLSVMKEELMNLKVQTGGTTQQ